MTTQEDVLDVLELLPVWQLRAPAVRLNTQSAEQVKTNAKLTQPIDAIAQINQHEDTTDAQLVGASEVLANSNAGNTEVERENERDAASVYEKPLSFIAENATERSQETTLQESIQQDFSQQESIQQATQYLVDYYQVGDFVFLTAATTRSEAVMTLLRNMLGAMRLTLPAAQSMYLSAHATTDAKVIISMGMMVSHALLDEETPFAHLRGSVQHLAAKPVIVTYDAQYLLDHPQDKPQAWADLCLAMQTLKNLT